MTGINIAVRGVLGTSIECRCLDTDAGIFYTLIGVPDEYKDGEFVEIYGVIQDMSFCMQGQTIGVHGIKKIAALTTKAEERASLIMGVNGVHVDVLLSHPPQFQIVAGGHTNTGGWTNPRLELITRVRPKDGIYDFKFIADRPPPGEKVNEMTMPVIANLLWSPGVSARGFRIHAATNTIAWPHEVAAMGGDTPFPWNKSVSPMGGEVPFPWNKSRSNVQPLAGPPYVWPWSSSPPPVVWPWFQGG